MALEAKLYIETAIPISFICADGTGIEKGTLLKLTDPLTVAASDGDADIIAGIAAEEKIANDGRTEIAVYTEGFFIMTAGGAVSVGDNVVSNATTGAANEVVKMAVAANSTAGTVGTAQETAADTDTFVVKLEPRKFEWPA